MKVRIVLFFGLVAMWSACTRPAPPPPATSAGTADLPLNLLLVTLDTVRADHVGVYGSPVAVTPNLDRLAKDGVRFSTAWAPAPLTLPSHATILSGLLPPRHGVRLNGGGAFPDRPTTLATHLKAAGYRAGAFVGAFVLDHRFGLARGFEIYDDEISAGARASAGLEAERPAREVVDRALVWLERASEVPFFAWVHLYDAHAPYEPPEPYRSRFAERPYDGEIAAIDAEVGRLLAELDRLGVAERTVVAVVGDHGEALGEHGELTHGLLLYEPSLGVPLVIRAPGRVRSGTVVGSPVSLADLAPTLAGLVGEPLAVEDRLDGRDLSAELAAGLEPAPADLYAESRYAATFGWSPLAAVRRGSFKFIAAPQPELYDLASDPLEGRNLLLDDPGKIAEYTVALAALAAGEGSAAPAQLDSEARAKLASLGYLVGGDDRETTGAAPDPKAMISLFRTFEEAHWALEGGRVDEARGRFESLVAADPRNPVFVGQLAEACRRSGEPGRAVELYRRALALDPNDREARYNLAVTLQEAGLGAEAVVALRTAIALDPGRPEAHNALGLALSAAGDSRAALAEFSRAVQLDPRDSRAHNNMGNVLRELGRRGEAEAEYRRAVDIDPSYPDPVNGLGALAVAGGRPDEAVELFDRALGLAPDQHEILLNRAIALELAGRRHEAVAAYREFLAKAERKEEFREQSQAARGLLARLEAGGAVGGGRKEGADESGTTRSHEDS